VVDATGVAAQVRWAVPQGLAVRALAPLVSNAVGLARTRVLLSTRAEPGGLLALLVEDDGPGVHEQQREAIFLPGQTSGTGAGLGLALARRIARSGGGDVVLEAAPGCTRFALRLPAAGPPPAPPASGSGAGAA
jgi:signal transduction histidine kinase